MCEHRGGEAPRQRASRVANSARSAGGGGPPDWVGDRDDLLDGSALAPVNWQTISWVSNTESCYHGRSGGRAVGEGGRPATPTGELAIPVRLRPVSLIGWNPMHNDGRNVGKRRL